MNKVPRSPSNKYQKISLGTRFFLSLRWGLTPYAQMAGHLPNTGKILDLGCGHGLLALFIAEAHPQCEVWGIDHDPQRINAATIAAANTPNAHFSQGSLLSPPEGLFTGMALIDVMHYFEPELQMKIFQEAFLRLSSEGVLLVREVDPAGRGIASCFNRLYEKLATATGFTQAAQPGLYFRTPTQWTYLLEQTGFQVTQERCSSRLFADILYVCRKKSHS